MDFNPAPSRIQILLTFALACAAFIGLMLVGLNVYETVAFTIAIAASCLHQLFWIMGKSKCSIVKIQWLEGSWWLTLADGRVVYAELTGPRVVLPWVVSVSFDIGTSTIGCALVKDSVTPCVHRKFRRAILMSPYQQSKWRLAVAGWYQNSIRRLGRS